MGEYGASGMDKRCFNGNFPDRTRRELKCVTPRAASDRVALASSAISRSRLSFQAIGSPSSRRVNDGVRRSRSETIHEWLSQIDKDTKDKQKNTAFDLWLECRTQEEISQSVGVDRTVISDWTQSFVEIGKLSESHKSRSNHSIDFTPPLLRSVEAANENGEIEALQKCRF